MSKKNVIVTAPDHVGELGLEPRYVAALTGIDELLPAIIELFEPRGHVASIYDPEVLCVITGKPKALSFR